MTSDPASFFSLPTQYYIDTAKYTQSKLANGENNDNYSTTTVFISAKEIPMNKIKEMF